MSKDMVRVGIVGLGTIGLGVVRAVRRHRRLIRSQHGVDVQVTRVADIDKRRLRVSRLSKGRLSTDYADILNDPEIDIVVELVGGTGVALDVVTRALNAGKHVVTANKALMAKHWRRILSLAHRKGCGIGFESSVMAGVPVIRGICEGLAGNAVRSVLGILNGTSNYVLTQMFDNRTGFDEAIAAARKNGFCEADASLDIDGYDAAQKLAILGSIATGRWLSPAKVHREGIGHIQQDDLIDAYNEFGYVMRPLAILKVAGDAVEARVHPTFVPGSHRLASIRDEFNAVLVEGDCAGPVTFAGRGAGKAPAAGGVMSDLVGIARALTSGGRTAVPLVSAPDRKALKVVPMKDTVSKFYLRFFVLDRPGVLSFTSGVLGKCGVSIRSCHQRGGPEGGFVDVVMITHAAREGSLRKALSEIDARRSMVGRKTIVIRIEE